MGKRSFCVDIEDGLVGSHHWDSSWWSRIAPAGFVIMYAVQKGYNEDQPEGRILSRSL